MINLTGYEINETLYQGKRTEVYGGKRIDDQQPVIIKILRNPHPNFNELVQFRNQYTITRNLEHLGIVQPLALEIYGNGYALIMPNKGAISLPDYWQNCNGSLSKFLKIAIQLAEILHYLNTERIVHKDIKPANIIICPQTHQIKLIDFSISSLLPKEQQQLINPNVLEGTLAYISPEQTGRMNRGIDYRTDFYSLGVTFYEMLTGILPFDTNDPMELVHCHIAQSPLSPHIFTDRKGKNYPEVISNIVMKLMAKNAEDRYQSALGLKHDLEQCLQQLATNGEITWFEIGQRDICDRFLVPEHLYGREFEVQTLLNAFDRVANPPKSLQGDVGATEMMLVVGFSGIGKTAVVNEIHKPIVKQRGYFVKGKFDQFNRNVPFSAFVQAFRDLITQLLGESDTELRNWKSKILDALGENSQVIIDVIPELEIVVGTQPPVTELSGTAAQNRFNLLFDKFIHIFTTKEHPLTIFLDDLQWADLASLNLLKLLMNSSKTGYLLVLGAYRDNEVFPAHPLMLNLAEIQKQGINLNTLTLAPLEEDDITQLVADTLHCEVEIAAPLSQLVYQKARGNPFFTTQFLVGLYQDGYIKFNRDALYWQCDLTEVLQLSLTDDVVEFMVSRLQKLPETTQDILKFAACIGNQFDLETLAIACDREPEEVAAYLWTGLQEKFVLPKNENYKFFQVSNGEVNRNESVSVSYRFLHDRVQQAAYSLIPENQKAIVHYRIGQLLLQQIPPEEQEERIFELVGQLNYGTVLITEQKEKDDLAQLNLIACRKARSATAYQAGREFASTGLSLLGNNAWQRQYEINLEFHQFAAEFAYLCGDFEAMDRFIEKAIEQARASLDRVNIYLIKIQSNSSLNKLTEAVAVGQVFLQQLGITFPEPCTQTDIQKAFQEIGELIKDIKIEDLACLPMMKNEKQIAILKIANSIMPASYLSGSPLYPILVTLSVKLSIQYGNTSGSAIGYSCYGLLACNLLQDVDVGRKFGQLALQIVSILDAKAVKADVINVMGLFILHRTSHLKETLSLMKEGYTAALEIGHLEYVGHAASIFCFNYFWCSHSLTTLEQETRSYCNVLVQLNQLTGANWCRIYLQSILNLMAVGQQPTMFSGEVLEEKKVLPQLLSSNDLLGLYFFYLYKFMLSYLFGEIESAQNYAIQVKQYLKYGAGTIGEPVFYLYDSLTALADINIFSKDNSELIERTEQNYTQLKQHWASYAPMNHQHKVDLIEAEKCRVLGQKITAIEMYDRAISGAKENGYIQEEALANELAAKFYLNWGKEKIAQTYMVEAYYCYARWGAKAKIDQLETTYAQMLAPILQQLTSFLPINTTITLTPHQTVFTSTNTNTSVFDISAAVKASQTLSGEIELEALLAKLMQIVLENAGADKGALILNNAGTWEIVAECIQQECQLSSIPLENTNALPVSIVRVVQRTQQTILLNQLEKDTRFASDSYLMQQQPKSLFCIPILSQGQLLGILYLENNLSVGAFTQDRVEILNMLCSQAAISLENARLYQQAQTHAQQAQDYAKQLEKSLKDLQQAQLQLVQSEKMSALGNLVAGVAHEINNPVGFIVGNLKHAQDYVQDLLNLIDLYAEKYPNPEEEIEAEIEEMDLEFVREDLPKLIGSMTEGTERIRHISTSLRNFSRTDTEKKVFFNLQNGIESTLLILKHRLKRNEKRPAIEVVKYYSDLPEVKCFPGQLNQVFMNLIANAIDALEESNKELIFKDISVSPNQIKIQTEATLEEVMIRIADNGVGMTEIVKNRIFEQGFTTKEVGKGTGLGMAIAHQIITEKHGGTITCRSELGKGTEFTIVLTIDGKSLS